VIRVLITGASAVVRAGLTSVLRESDQIEVAGVVAPDEFSDAIEHTTADVALIALPQVTEDWMALFSAWTLPVVLLTEVADAVLLPVALHGSVRAVLSADASSAEIIAAISSAAAGLISMQPSFLEALTADHRTAPVRSPDEPLSPREIEVLGLLAEGLSNKLIAHQLGISEHTVKFHVASILGKLQASSRTDAVMQGIRRGLVMM
jgi:DNA-binding NarL/FixJ family response regulator